MLDRPDPPKMTLDGAEVPATGIVVRQARRAVFHRLVSQMPLIALVRRGTKAVTWDKGRLIVESGGMVMLAERVGLTVENIPDADGRYEAQAVFIDRHVFDEAYAFGEEAASARSPAVHLAVPTAGAVACFDQLCAQKDALPPRIAEVRRQELIGWLAEQGAVLPPPGPPKWSDRVRTRVAADPSRPWMAPEMARALAVSVPTLRRRLAAEGTCFRDIVADARMTTALGLIQTTGLSLARIAAEVGYESPSRFAARFRQRFGVAPRDLRRPVLSEAAQ